MEEQMKIDEILSALDRWSNIHRDRPFNVSKVASADKNSFNIELAERYSGKNISSMLEGQDGKEIEALLQSDYLNCNIDGRPIRKFLDVKHVASKPSSVKFLLNEESIFKWAAIYALADKLNIMREQGSEVFDNVYGVSVMGEYRKSPLVSCVDKKVASTLQKTGWGREHSPFSFNPIDARQINVRNAYSRDDHEKMAFIETLSGHPLTPIEPPYTPELFEALAKSGERQYIADILKTAVGYASVIFDASQEPKPLELGGVRGSYDGVSYVNYLSVLRSAQRKGVGRKILANIERDSKELGKKAIYLNTPTVNTDAVSFYSTLGFKVNNVIPDKYAPGSDSVLMCKKID